MKVYHITVIYDDKTKQWEYLCEDVTEELNPKTERRVIRERAMKERGVVNLADYFDEEGLELIAGCYIMGEA